MVGPKACAQGSPPQQLDTSVFSSKGLGNGCSRFVRGAFPNFTPSPQSLGLRKKRVFQQETGFGWSPPGIEPGSCVVYRNYATEASVSFFVAVAELSSFLLASFGEELGVGEL